MVQIKKHPRNNRADYFALKSYIDSTYMVSGAIIPALNTSERISSRSVSLTDMVTHWTGLGSVCTGHEYKRDSSKSGFVFDETSDLCKCPRMLSVALSFSNRHSGSDTFELICWSGYQNISKFLDLPIIHFDLFYMLFAHSLYLANTCLGF